ncbi:hypothetical protein ACJJTC_009661 [Scirpophaga incertulas]
MWEKWNMPNCVSSIDGKHVRIKAPQHSGSLFLNYKDYFSIVMLALVDADYKFVAIDAGSYGKEGDSNIYRKSIIGKKIERNDFNIPESKVLPGTNINLPHFMIGDEAFPLDTNMMKPYSRRSRLDRQKEVFNYRLCRARRVAENAFGLLSQVPYYIRDENQNPSDNMIDSAATTSTVHDGINVRNELKLFFNSQMGQVSWQNNYC